MSDFVTHPELNEAIEAVLEDIRDSEERLRKEFTTTMRWELQRITDHLGEQDETLKWINRWTLGVLVSVIVALILLLSTGIHIGH